MNQTARTLKPYIRRSGTDESICVIVSEFSVETYDGLRNASNAYFRDYGKFHRGLKSAFDLNVFLYDRLIDNMDMNGDYDKDFTNIVTFDQIEAWFGPYGDKIRAEIEERAEAEAEA